jgi:hypothetical protein
MIEAALALHRLENDGRHLARIDIGLEQALNGVKRILRAHAVQRDGRRHVIDATRERSEARLVRHHLARQRHAHERTTVERARECDHTWAARVRPCDLDGVFHCLCASGEERGLLGVRAGRDRIQALGQLDV